MILNYQNDMEVVATAAVGVEPYQKEMEYKPDVLLMDLRMPPGEPGLIPTSKFADSFPEPKILKLKRFDDGE
ncbi:LuxR family transcriptional regulator, partial [Staphylococcus aureus]